MSLIKVNNRSLGTGTVTHGVLPAGTVLSVNSARKVDTFSMSATSFADVPGLSVTVTPKSASSKFLVSASICCGNDWWHANNYFGIYLHERRKILFFHPPASPLCYYTLQEVIQ